MILPDWVEPDPAQCWIASSRRWTWRDGLLAAYFFSNGSTRLHQWLRRHPRFGPYVRDWEDEQVIPPIGKYASTLLMVPSVGYVVLTGELPLVVSGIMVATVVAALWYIWSPVGLRGRNNFAISAKFEQMAITINR